MFISGLAGTLIRGALLVTVLASCAAPQPAGTAQTEIRAALTRWMEDFNAGRAEKVCGLFAPDLIADYRGQPERTYGELCDLLQRSLNDPTRRFTYSLAIKEILVSGDMAIVRLVWTLKVVRKDVPGEITGDEPGLDVFRRQPDGSWRIARYMGYDASP
jgi:ketosteroid isomerase-like protein